MAEKFSSFEKIIREESQKKVREAEEWKGREIKKLLEKEGWPKLEGEKELQKKKENVKKLYLAFLRGREIELGEEEKRKREEINQFLQDVLGEKPEFLQETEATLELERISEEEKTKSHLRLVEALFDYRTLKNQEEIYIQRYQKLQEVQAEHQELDGALLQEMIAKAIEERHRIKERLEELLNQSPEAFLGISRKELREYKKQLDQGQLVETPWVKEKKEEIIGLLRSHRNCFLFGETGTGKTEIGRQIARELTGKEAVMIRGHRFLGPEEVWGYLGLAPREEEISEYEIEKQIRKEHPDISDKDLAIAVKYVQEALKGKTPSGAVVTKYFAGPVIEALKEGKILIIDEANYINPGLLASLNEILANPSPGREITAPLTGEKIKIAKGFGVILTGNITFDAIKRYKERYEVDPALKDRVKFIEYNTPPQEIDRKEDYKSAKNKDLFLIALAQLVDKKGNLVIPGGETGLLKVWRLCQAFKLFQENFARRPTISYRDKSGGEYIFPLEKNHASLRKLRNILADWQREGCKTELDWYIWKELVEPSLTEPLEAAYFYQQLQWLYDFFKRKSGWDQNPDYGQGLALTKFEPKIPRFPPKAAKKEIVSLQTIAEAIRGREMPTEIIKTKEEIELERKIKETKELELELMTEENEFNQEYEEIEKVCL